MLRVLTVWVVETKTQDWEEVGRPWKRTTVRPRRNSDKLSSASKRESSSLSTLFRVTWSVVDHEWMEYLKDLLNTTVTFFKEEAEDADRGGWFMHHPSWSHRISSEASQCWISTGQTLKCRHKAGIRTQIVGKSKTQQMKIIRGQQRK